MLTTIGFRIENEQITYFPPDHQNKRVERRLYFDGHKEHSPIPAQSSITLTIRNGVCSGWKRLRFWEKRTAEGSLMGVLLSYSA